MNTKIGCCIVSLVVLLGLVAWDVSGSPQSGTAVNNSLSYVPSDSIFFVHLEGRVLWNSSIFDDMQKNLPGAKWKQFEKDVFQESEKVTGIARRDSQSVTIVIDSWEVPQVPGGALVLESKTPVDRNKLVIGVKGFLKSKLPQNDQENSNSPNVQHEGIELSSVGAISGQKLFAGLLQPNIAVVGELETIKKMIAQRKQGVREGALSESVKVAQGHDLALGLQFPESLHNQLLAMLQMAGGRINNIPEAHLSMKLFEALLDMEQMHLVVDIQKDLLVNISVRALNEQAATRFQRILDMSALFGDFGLHFLSDTSDQSASPLSKFKKFFQIAGEAAAKSKTTLTGNTVNFTMQAPQAGPEVMAALSTAATQFIGSQDRQNRMSHLRQLAIAMHNYHSDYMKLPSPGYYAKGQTVPKQGSGDKPMLSWRVYLLPYLESDRLFKQFHLDEPWDSEHNKKLISAMPQVYSCPGTTNTEPGMTNFQLFVAPEKPGDMNKQKFIPMFQMGRPGVTLGQLTVQDGTSNTIMIAESSKAVIWTKPDDILIENDDMPLPKLGYVPEEKDFLVAFGDGSVRAILRTLPNRQLHERLLRQLIGRRDGMNEDIAPIMNEPRQRSNTGFTPANPGAK